MKQILLQMGGLLALLICIGLTSCDDEDTNPIDEKQQIENSGYGIYESSNDTTKISVTGHVASIWAIGTFEVKLLNYFNGKLDDFDKIGVELCEGDPNDSSLVARSVRLTKDLEPDTIYNNDSTYITYFKHLKPNTEYSYRSYASCKNDTTFGEWKQFKTKNIHLNLSVSEVQNYSAKIGVQADFVVINADAAELYYRVDSIPGNKSGGLLTSAKSPIPDSAKFISDNRSTISLKGLNKDTHYEVAIFASLDGKSEPISTITFTTTDEEPTITLGQEKLTLEVGDEAPVSLTIKNYDRWSYSSSNDAVAYISNYTSYSVTIVASGRGTATITITANGVSKDIIVTVQSKSYEVYNTEPVDLGLSVDWANLNLGAASPEEHGYYFAWGEIAPSHKYTNLESPWAVYNYKFFDDSLKFTKYVSENSNNFTDYNTMFGDVDGKIELETEDDAATANLGYEWRIPTQNEWKELIDDCTWEWLDNGRASGYRISGKKEGYTNKSIFLPVSHVIYNEWQGQYWTRSLVTTCPSAAVMGYFTNSEVLTTYSQRACCNLIRAVKSK